MQQCTLRISIAQVRGLLIVNLPFPLSDQMLTDLANQLRERLVKRSCRAVIIDLSAVALLDHTTFQAIENIARCNQVFGAATTLAGLQAGVALYLAQCPFEFGLMKFARTMEKALQLHE
jgi:rsbT antagonist protein RsbS